MEKQKGCDRSQTEKAVEELICSQEDHPGTHVPAKDIAKGLNRLV